MQSFDVAGATMLPDSVVSSILTEAQKSEYTTVQVLAMAKSKVEAFYQDKGLAFGSISHFDGMETGNVLAHIVEGKIAEVNLVYVDDKGQASFRARGPGRMHGSLSCAGGGRTEAGVFWQRPAPPASPLGRARDPPPAPFPHLASLPLALGPLPLLPQTSDVGATKPHVVTRELPFVLDSFYTMDDAKRALRDVFQLNLYENVQVVPRQPADDMNLIAVTSSSRSGP